MRNIGASIAGPYRKKEGSLNQDAHLLQSHCQYQLAVVCDGMGSKLHARAGAQRATLAVQSAASIWMQHGQRNPERLIRLIHQIWNVMIEPLEAREAVTTCLLALVDRNGAGMMAQLGDGLILWQQGTEEIYSLKAAQRDFVNETTGLGIAKKTQDWRWQPIENFQAGHRLLLCTDGVSESLEEDQLPEFVEWLIRKYRWLPRPLAHWKLKQQLANWPNPHHQDDKTLCLLWA
jgi:serine/threonine protein phosphatase PrpC